MGSRGWWRACTNHNVLMRDFFFYSCKYPHTLYLPFMYTPLHLHLFFPPLLHPPLLVKTFLLSIFSTPFYNHPSYSFSPWPSSSGLTLFFLIFFLSYHCPPHPRARGPAAPAGQCHAGCDRHVPVDGGDREAGSASRPGGGEGSLLHFHRLPSTSRGEKRKDMGCVRESHTSTLHTTYCTLRTK